MQFRISPMSIDDIGGLNLAIKVKTMIPQPMFESSQSSSASSKSNSPVKLRSLAEMNYCVGSSSDASTIESSDPDTLAVAVGDKAVLSELCYVKWFMDYLL